MAITLIQQFNKVAYIGSIWNSERKLSRTLILLITGSCWWTRIRSCVHFLDSNCMMMVMMVLTMVTCIETFSFWVGPMLFCKKRLLYWRQRWAWLPHLRLTTQWWTLGYCWWCVIMSTSSHGKRFLLSRNVLA